MAKCAECFYNTVYGCFKESEMTQEEYDRYMLQSDIWWMTCPYFKPSNRNEMHMYISNDGSVFDDYVECDDIALGFCDNESDGD